MRPGLETSARTQTATPCRVPRFSNRTVAPSSSVSGDSNPIKLLTNPNLKGYRTILATNLLQAQLAQGETDVIVQPGEDFRIKLGDGAVVELLVEQLQAPHDSRDAANQQALREGRFTAKIRKQLALASLQKTPRSRTPVNGVTKDPALKRPTVGALAAFRCWRYCLGSHTVLLTYLRPLYKSCCVINLATTERSLAQFDTTPA